MRKKTRRDLHSAINSLTRSEVAAIIKRQHPRAKGERINELAKEAIAEAHRLVSPREK
jgi:hypothetical protein